VAGCRLRLSSTTSDSNVWKPGAHTGTFRGNQLGMATGLATLRYIRETGLAEHAARVGECLRQGLGKLLAAYPFLAEVRGRGLMIGVEVIDSTRCDRLGRFPGDGELARRIQRACFDLGLIVELGGRGGAVVRVSTPAHSAGLGGRRSHRHIRRRVCRDGLIRKQRPWLGRR